jgi:hypothetical protein
VSRVTGTQAQDTRDHSDWATERESAASESASVASIISHGPDHRAAGANAASVKVRGHGDSESDCPPLTAAVTKQCQ